MVALPIRALTQASCRERVFCCLVSSGRAVMRGIACRKHHAVKNMWRNLTQEPTTRLNIVVVTLIQKMLLKSSFCPVLCAPIRWEDVTNIDSVCAFAQASGSDPALGTERKTGAFLVQSAFQVLLNMPRHRASVLCKNESRVSVRKSFERRSFSLSCKVWNGMFTWKLHSALQNNDGNCFLSSALVELIFSANRRSYVLVCFKVC
eukprot:6435935-Amphidinium_carterae.1